MYMPCQCATTSAASSVAEGIQSGCGCETESGASCGCGDGPSPEAEAASSLERVVMELDKRVRALEAAR
jgi:type IV secretory pathway TrbL component